MGLTGKSVNTIRGAALSPPGTDAEAPRPNTSFLNISFALAAVGAILFYLTHSMVFGLAGIPLLIWGLWRPVDLLVATIAISPFTISLSGESYAGQGGPAAMFSVSDVLLLLAVPGLILSARQHRSRLSLGRITLPLLLFLFFGLISFALNLSYMHGLYRNYFMGYVRTAQMILLVPLFFSIVDWSAEDLRRMFRGYLNSCLFLCALGLVAFAAGQRNGLYMLGGQKNTIALTLAVGALIALAGLLPPRNESGSANRVFATTGMDRWFLILAFTLCCVTLVFGLSRSSFIGLCFGMLYLCVQRRQMRVFVAAMIGMALVGLIVHRMLPADAELSVTNLTEHSKSNHQRLTYIHLSMERFRGNRAFGDGFRSRRDYLPHNLEVTLLAETGVVGLALFSWALIVQFRLLYDGAHEFGGDPTREWASVIIFISSIAILVQAQFDPYWRRGPLLLTWAGMGILLSMRRRQTEQLSPKPEATRTDANRS